MDEWRGIGVASPSINVFVRRNFAFHDQLLKHSEDLDILFEGLGVASLGLHENCSGLLLGTAVSQNIEAGLRLAIEIAREEHLSEPDIIQATSSYLPGRHGTTTLLTNITSGIVLIQSGLL